VSGPIVDLLRCVKVRADDQRVHVERCTRAEAAARRAHLGAAELEIDRRPVADRADQVQR
jgi:hypothetical protein